MNESQDADRWLCAHEAELVGAGSAAAVDLIQGAGLTASVARYRGVASSPDGRPSDLIRLFIGDDGTVRTAEAG